MDKKITLKLAKVKSRKHFILFCENTPFMPKIEKSKKKEYKRNPKHRNKDEN